MIQVEKLCIQAGEFQLKDVSFTVPTGEYAILMGRTGSGKTTILETICGLRKITSGKITLSDRDVTHRKPAERGIGFVPQEGALFPTMNVADQIGFSLTLRKWTSKKIERRVNELAELLEIDHLLSRSVKGLSGGERQRIALGRALASQPDILCLDEPLSALDDSTKNEMFKLLKSIQDQTGVTTLHISHHQSEAKILGNTILLMENGIIRNINKEDLQNELLGEKEFTS